MAGKKFRRQHSIAPYVVDFLCVENALIIELDGGQHAKRQEADQARTAFLKQQGYRVIRFWNDELFDNLEVVLEIIHRNLNR